MKVYIGAPASQNAAGDGYVSASTLASYVADAQKKYDSFGGVMLWDASQAYGAWPVFYVPALLVAKKGRLC